MEKEEDIFDERFIIKENKESIYLSDDNSDEDKKEDDKESTSFRRSLLPDDIKNEINTTLIKNFKEIRDNKGIKDAIKYVENDFIEYKNEIINSHMRNKKQQQQIKVSNKTQRKEELPLKSINQVLLPYDEKIVYNHPWLDIKTWGPSNDKGSYTRLLDKSKFTLFKKNEQWKYVYKHYYSDEYRSLPELLKATYEKYGKIIRTSIRYDSNIVLFK
jgi:hypothetical protein